MTFITGHFEKAKDGNAVIDWVVLMAGVVLLSVSVVLTLVPRVDRISDQQRHTETAATDIRPA